MYVPQSAHHITDRRSLSVYVWIPAVFVILQSVPFEYHLKTNVLRTVESFPPNVRSTNRQAATAIYVGSTVGKAGAAGTITL